LKRLLINVIIVIILFFAMMGIYSLAQARSFGFRFLMISAIRLKLKWD
jgi:hypothetical protein